MESKTNKKYHANESGNSQRHQVHGGKKLFGRHLKFMVKRHTSAAGASDVPYAYGLGISKKKKKREAAFVVGKTVPSLKM
jgi:hypothetical protein